MPRITARPRDLIELARREVSDGFDRGLLRMPGVDTYRLAAQRRIHTIYYRPLLADGCLLVDSKGFSVQINDGQESVVHPGQDADDRALSAKQRFSLAHEIAHTLPYDLEPSPPRLKSTAIAQITETGGREAPHSLEMFCQIAAGFMLVSPAALKHADALGRWGTVDSVDTVLRLARCFRISPEVLMHRISNSSYEEEVKANYVAMVFVRSLNGKELIMAYIHSPTLSGIAGEPRLYSMAKTWVARTPALKKCEVLAVAEGKWRMQSRTGILSCIKVPYGRTGGSYFLELKFSPS